MEIKPTNVKAITPYTIWVRFSDNTEGSIDLSHLATKPVFKKWTNPAFFSNVYIDSETDAIAWDSEIELCPDSLYMKIRGLSFEQFKDLN